MAVTARHIETMRRTLDRVRDLMGRGPYGEAMEFLNTLYQAAGYWEWTRDPELQEILDEARSLAGELRGHMHSMAGHGPQLGAQGERSETNYVQLASQDAVLAVEHFMDDVVDQILKKGFADDDIESYSSGYHHERHVDRSYSLRESVEVLEQLGDHQPDDSGVWQGMAPTEAIPVMAALTYGNAVHYMFHALIERIHEEIEEIAPPAGPKEWSPRRKGLTKKEVEDVVREELDREREG